MTNIANNNKPKKILEKNGSVYLADFPTQVPYNMSIESEKKEADEYTKLNKDTENIIYSLNVTN